MEHNTNALMETSIGVQSGLSRSPPQQESLGQGKSQNNSQNQISNLERSPNQNLNIPDAPRPEREIEENEKDLLFPPNKAFYLVGFDQRQSREKLYKAIKKYCWVVKFDLPRSQKKGCQNKGYAFVHTCSKEIVESIVGG